MRERLKESEHFLWNLSALRIESVEKIVEILAQVEEKIVGVAYKNQLAFSFHPELTGNDRIHDKFLELIRVSNN